MQKVIGLIYFKGKTIDDIKSAFNGFKLDDTEVAFFSSLFRYDKEIPSPGVFITGSVNDSHSSGDIINILRKKAGLNEELKGYDVSIESEDTLKSLVDGELKGTYLGIRIRPPYDLDKIYVLASKVGKVLKAHDVFVRTVEPEKDGRPLVCMDFITQDNFEKHKNEVEDIISSEGLVLGQYTSFYFA